MKRKTLGIIALLCGLGLSGGLITNFVMDENRVPTRTLGAGAFQVAVVRTDGTLDKEDKSKIVSDLTTVDGMEVVLKEDATITYVLHWFNEDKELLSSTDKQTDDFEGEAVEGAKYFRAEITPVGDEDGEVSIFELPGYALQLEITVNK